SRGGGSDDLCCRSDPLWFGLCTTFSMSKSIPTIETYMTTLPHSIGDEQTLSKASQIMKERNIRHLPVLRGGKLLGILTDRDVHLIESLGGANAETLPVSEAMTEEPFTVSPDAALSEVAEEMAANKYGSAVVRSEEHT